MTKEEALFCRRIAADPADTPAVAVLDLTSSARIATLRLPDGFGPVIFGRLFHPAEAPLAPSMLMPDLAAALQPMAILVDGRSRAVVAQVGEAGATEPLHLPDGAAPLAVDGPHGLLAIRRRKVGDAVLRLPKGEPAWEAPNGKAGFRGFASGRRFIGVEDAAGERLESLAGGLRARTESGRRTDWTSVPLGSYTPIVAVEVAEARPRPIFGTFSENRELRSAPMGMTMLVWLAHLRWRYALASVTEIPDQC